jgi:hypothetical protein
MAVIERLVPQRLTRLWRPYGGCRMLIRCLLYPRTFSEKVQRVKIFNRDPRLPQRENKILVKDFVRDRLGGEWVTPTLWHGEYLPPLEERNWPIPFVIKANNGCGWNVFVRQKSDLDWPRIESLAAEWRDAPFGAELGEWLYGEIKPALLVEPFVGNPSDLPIDYKFWTFGGKVQFIQVDTDREHEHKRVMFDSDWRRLPFTYVYLSDPRSIPKPASLDRMIKAAEILAEDFPFVRIDFYEVDSIPKFGEISFYPESGFGLFNPPEWDVKIGRLWR